jgi:hypothetical protein
MIPTASRAALAALLIALGIPSGAGAQGLRIALSLGGYAPRSELGDVQGASGLIEFGKKESTLAYGLSLDLGAAEAPVGFRFGVAYAGRSDVPIDGVGCTTCQLRSTLLAASADLILQPLPGVPVLRPYAVVGAGAKLYDFDPDTFTKSLVEDQAQFVGHFGIGARLFPDASLGFLAEVSDYVSGFEFVDGDGDLQHDLLFRVGVRVGFGR